MQIKSLSVTTNKETASILKVEAELVEVIIVSVTITNSTRLRSGSRSKQKKAAKTGKTNKAGTKQTKPLAKKDQKKKSALRTLLG